MAAMASPSTRQVSGTDTSYNVNTSKKRATSLIQRSIGMALIVFHSVHDGLQSEVTGLRRLWKHIKQDDFAITSECQSKQIRSYGKFTKRNLRNQSPLQL